jgi:hypothetical protein
VQAQSQEHPVTQPVRDPSAGRRVVIMTAVMALITGGLIWNLVFDMWLGQVERQYLWENARHELKLGPAVSLKAMMEEARSQGLLVAAGWSLLVVLAIAFAAWYSYRQGTRADGQYKV